MATCRKTLAHVRPDERPLHVALRERAKKAKDLRLEGHEGASGLGCCLRACFAIGKIACVLFLALSAFGTQGEGPWRGVHGTAGEQEQRKR